MSNQHPQDDPSTTLGVGGTTSGQQGATPRHETQQETGGSGGDGLSRNQSGETTNAPDGAVGGGQHAEAPDSAMTHVARGPLDTRPDQASPTGTGLGTPETGANQDEGDLPPAR
ncbi:hypothetical protein [Massilia yuzhufengensis]|uniref:Uncharacterized protein n=1 Tax=Massilia yuzhufengensis TaxID=1164594 RepID=A0A1I1QY34_9BURK|nr:hypothetical protein [Massilia yuzhufengensis]SFD27041.1 hypothetical protein SAMN05216204_12088 [Massilia yuzhufengensis]